MRSLRQHLLLWLLPPLLTVGAVATTGAYLFMERRLTAAYDLDLGDIARTIVPYVRVVRRPGPCSLSTTGRCGAARRQHGPDLLLGARPRGNVVAGERELPHPPIAPAASCDSGTTCTWARTSARSRSRRSSRASRCRSSRRRPRASVTSRATRSCSRRRSRRLLLSHRGDLRRDPRRPARAWVPSSSCAARCNRVRTWT